MGRPTVICMAPVRNEASILDRFLQCASLWADRTIVGDHCSDDGSREVASRYPKVDLLFEDSPDFSEGPRRAPLVRRPVAMLVPGFSCPSTPTRF